MNSRHRHVHMEKLTQSAADVLSVQSSDGNKAFKAQCVTQ